MMRALFLFPAPPALCIVWMVHLPPSILGTGTVIYTVLPDTLEQRVDTRQYRRYPEDICVADFIFPGTSIEYRTSENHD